MRVVHGARGFCNINIEAVMVEWIRKNYPHIKKIAIVDTDCHHGDGSQDIYWHDPNVLYISMHQDGRTLYPGSGFTDEFGGPGALGLTLNVPLPPRTSDQGFLHAIENLILPVLDEFKPDLIVNSAGQDNHYSDPITHMAFTARGYARLNELLDPDICVLEGGYSIESALPYINTGIILALAGVDYSFVREPDLEPEEIREEPGVMDYIKALCDSVLDAWRQRKKHNVPNKPFVERTRRIYYDTDGISESQQETLRFCSECPGVFKIDTQASTGYRALCVHIPHGACQACRQQGREWFDTVKAGYYAAYLQDMDNDAYQITIL